MRATVTEELKYILSSTIARYSERYKKLGRNVRTLGWGSEEQQYHRFMQAQRVIPIEGKRILDIGCGFGDFLACCRAEEIYPRHYIGWDINPDLIAEASQQHPDSTFDIVNLAELEVMDPVAEVGVMLGVLNLNFKNSYDNFEFSKMMIEKAFSSVSEALVVDFLSIYKTPTYPAEDFVFYHDPSAMLGFGLSLTPNVSLYHDYSPIPQKEFMMVLKHVR